MKKENYDQSIQKWKQFREKIKSGDFSECDADEREIYLLNKIWNTCGFCKEFGNAGHCRSCPLVKKHCYNFLYLMPDTHTVKKIFDSFVCGDDKKAIKLISTFIRSMNQYKNHHIGV